MVHSTLCQTALKDGVDVNSTDNEGRTGFFWALTKSHISLVELLLGTPGIDINATESHSRMITVHATVPHLYNGQTENHEGLALLLACPGQSTNQTSMAGALFGLQ